VGLRDLKALLSWDMLKGMMELGKAIYDGKIGIAQIGSSMASGAVEPFRYVFGNSKDVWFGSPCNNDVYEYGKQMGSMVNTLIGTIFGVGVGTLAFKAISKVAPKFVKAISGLAKKVNRNTLLKKLTGVASKIQLEKTSNLRITHEITMGKNKFNKFVETIEKEGIKDPIKYVEYNGEKYVVDGHHRLKAAKILGMKEVPTEKVELPYLGYKTFEDL
jgi:hypothetical protein